MTAIYMASKVEEIKAVHVQILTRTADDQYSVRDVTQTEAMMFQLFHFNLLPCTVYDFANWLLLE